MRLSRTIPIEPGMRFLRLSNGAPVARRGRPEIWKVTEIRTDPSGIDHARLIEVDQPNRSKTFSVSVLRDPTRYRPVT